MLILISAFFLFSFLLSQRHRSIPVVLLAVTPFAAIYVPYAGRNIRAETLITFLLIMLLAIRFLAPGRGFKFHHTKLNLPLCLFILILTASVVRTYLFPLFPIDPETRLVKSVNGIRLILAYSSFLIVLSYVAANQSERFIQVVVKAIIAFSFITSIAAILLIIDRYMFGRRLYVIFASLDRGWHGWSKMISFQALLLFGLLLEDKSSVRKGWYLLYFIFLFAIVFFMSVRSSIIGLAISCALLLGLRTTRRDKRYFQYFSIVLLLVLGMSVFKNIHSTNYYVNRVQGAVPDILSPGGRDVTRLSNLGTRSQAFENTMYLLSNEFQTMIFGGGYYGFSFLTESIIGMEWGGMAHNSFLQIIGDQGIVGFAGAFP